MAGLLAARALAGHFARVTICERDPAPTNIKVRKGVPQGVHAHALLQSGQHVLEAFFPNLVDELIAAGTTAVDLAVDVCWFHHGYWKIRYPSNMTLLFQSRPFLEWHVRRRLAALPNVTWRQTTAVTNLLSNAARTRVTGVQLQQTDPSATCHEISADLVVDASGYGSRLPDWLTALEYPVPRASTLQIGLTYTSRFYRWPSTPRDWSALVLFPKAPESTRAGYLFPVEGQRWIVSLVGYMGDTPPSDEMGFLAYARSLAQPDIYQAISQAEPLSDIKAYHVPEIRWRHYEKLRRFPDGLLVVGDAVCRFDPIFGQGMSAAAQEAHLLEQMLHTEGRQGNTALTGFAPRFHRAMARVVSVPWSLAISEDCRYPQVVGQRPWGMALQQWYVAQIFTLSAIYPDVYGSFLEVMNLLKRPRTLFAPSILCQVLKQTCGGGAE
jgi:2-polyprenyl-6-methoxyphenol hydroxylase-like FAD-dependent oxidoreductase